MRILLTGANGYIGKRLLYHLIEAGYEVYCAVRDADRFNHQHQDHPLVTVIELDFLKPETLVNLPDNIQGAYYLMHAMSGTDGNFSQKEELMAENFVAMSRESNIEHVVYLGGIVNDKSLSSHLKSRLATEEILSNGSFHLTSLRAGIIVGSGSASFEIIRDLVEKLPMMVAPRWLNTKSHPIAVKNVLEYLSRSLFKEEVYDRQFDIAGPDLLSYKEMLKGFAEVRGLRRWIYTIPVLTPKLSSYWLYFVTSTRYALAQNLVDSMKVEVRAQANDLSSLLGIELISYRDALKRAFSRIKQNQLVSSWKDAMTDEQINKDFEQLVEVPEFGCYKDHKSRKLTDVDATLDNIWRIGGDNGWYYGTWLWKIRGYLDKLSGGVGLRRGRTNPDQIYSGDSLDFWRVIVADKEERRLLLFAEMKLPGDAWLEFKIDKNDTLHQTATFRPKGLFGRLYWLAVLPFHHFVFNGMIEGIVSK